MIVIGVTGPTGAGKTTALRVLEELGVRVFDCDAVYHALLRKSAALRADLTARFGPVFSEGQLDRRRLGQLVWADPQALADLNAITHGHILAELRRDLAAARMEKCPGAAIDAIALFESGAAALCDTTVAVVAPEEVRLRRIMVREEIGPEYARARIRAQKPAEWFQSRCAHTLVNDGGAEEFRAEARALFRTLLEKS